MQPSLIPLEPSFDGATFVHLHDQARLTKQMQRVFHALASERWLTLFDLSCMTGDPEASVSARIRDLRKSRFGAWTIERRRAGNPSQGKHEYRLCLPEGWR